MKNLYETVDPITEKIKGRIKSSLSGFLRFFVVGLLVLLQLAVIIFLPFALSDYTIYFYFILEVLGLCIIFSLVNDNRSPSFKVAWVCIVLALPISGHIMYALWGKQGSKKKLEEKILAKFRHVTEQMEMDESILSVYEEHYPTKSRMCKYMMAEGFPLFQNNDITYFPMGEDAFSDIFVELKDAKRFILIDFFIVGEGVIWDHMHEILLQKLKEGIEVLFLYDDFGAMLRTKKGFRKELIEEGFQVRVFNPIHKYTDKLYMNYRSHQKIIVIDGNIGYTGGFNLADEYANLIERFGVWKDNCVKVTGEAVWGLTTTFFQMWEASGTTTHKSYDCYKPDRTFPKNSVFCQVISDGPANNPNNPIENVYMQMIQYATEYVYITTPYLVLESYMKEALITAARSGIDVRIITPFIPDKKNVKQLTNYNYGELLLGGVKIYEYVPGFIHAKTIINEDCGIVGTINMDYRSFYLHYECGLWMSNRSVIHMIKEDFNNTFKECKEITYEEWKNRPITQKIYQSFLNMFSTLM